MADNNPTIDTSVAAQEPTSTEQPHPRSPLSKIMDAVKKPFHHHHGKEETPPALKDAIQKMEARKAGVAEQMESEGKDTNVLSGKRTDQVGL